MNTKTITVLATIAIILIAFITNPSQQKHSDVVIEQMVEHENKSDANSNALVTGALTGITKMLFAQEVKVKNYYLFSISYLHSKKRDKTIYAGLGLFGQVFPIASEQDWKEWD